MEDLLPLQTYLESRQAWYPYLSLRRMSRGGLALAVTWTSVSLRYGPWWGTASALLLIAPFLHSGVRRRQLAQEIRQWYEEGFALYDGGYRDRFRYHVMCRRRVSF